MFNKTFLTNLMYFGIGLLFYVVSVLLTILAVFIVFKLAGAEKFNFLEALVGILAGVGLGRMAVKAKYVGGKVYNAITGILSTSSKETKQLLND